MHKLCTGPAHDEPTWLPATEKYFYVHKKAKSKRPGSLSSRCRLCANWAKLKSPGLSGLVPIEEVRPYFIEGVNRVGYNEFERRTGCSRNTIRYAIDGKHAKVQKRTVRKVMLEVISMRRKDEVRHKDSIRTGAHLRGWQEKPVTAKEHLYKPHGDNDSEQRRNHRRRSV